MGRKISRRKKLAIFGAICAGLFLLWQNGTGVATLAGLSSQVELREVSITKVDKSLKTTSFYRDDPELAEGLAAFLGGLECRYHHTEDGITTSAIVFYKKDGEKLGPKERPVYDLQFYGVEGRKEWYSESISVLEGGRVYLDGKCYYLKKGHAPDCITARLEEILQEYPENAVTY